MGSKPPPLLRAPLSPSKLHSIATVGKYDRLAHFRVISRVDSIEALSTD